MIIGITGTLGAGKGTIVEFLKSKGFKHLSVRQFLIEEINKRGMENNRDSMVIVGNELREKHHPGYIVEQLYKQANNKNAVIESIRTEGEIATLKNYGDFALFAVDAYPKLRFERIKARQSETDNIDFQTFLKNEKREMTSDNPNKQNLKKCIGLANYKFTNNRTKEELYLQVEFTLKQILN